MSLFNATSCKAILTPKGYKLQPGVLDKSDLAQYEIQDLLELIAEGDVKQYSFTKSYDEAKDDPLVVLHSSGSTGLPKPIVLTHSWISAFDRHRLLKPFEDCAPTLEAFLAKSLFCSMPPFHVSYALNSKFEIESNTYYCTGFWLCWFLSNTAFVIF